MSGVKVGKKLIYILAEGMYEDPRFIFREYIQNAADQIDLAIKDKIISEDEAQIMITIDRYERNIVVFDNATGIRSDRVAQVLGDIADSEKSGVDTKGFIGIGRLGGLAYCKKLQFITSFQGEAVKTIMTWDSDALHDLLRDPHILDDAAQVIRRVFNVETEPTNIDDHYFEVRLLSIHRSNDDLLNVESVREYLSMVAPVPYESAFFFANKIKKHIVECNYPSLSEYKIWINKEQLFKAYRKNIYRVVGNNKEKIDELHDVNFKEFALKDGTMLAWMWFGISKFETQIHKNGNIQRGLRIRCKNIQIGDETTINQKKLFKEDRGTFYFVGEIHVVNNAIKPNARRDYFIQDHVTHELEKGLKVFFTEYLQSLYRTANVAKNAYKKENELEELKKTYQDKKNNGFISKTEEEELKRSIKAKITELEKNIRIHEKIAEKAEEDPILSSTISAIEKKYRKPENKQIDEEVIAIVKPVFLSEQLSKLDRGKRRVVERIFDIIHKVLPPDQADELVAKICDELKK